MPPFADDALEVEVVDDVGLVDLLADAGGGTGGDKVVFAVLVLAHDRAAVVDDAAVEQLLQPLVELGFCRRDAVALDVGLDQKLMRGITAGDDHAVEVDGIAGAQLADLLVRDRYRQGVASHRSPPGGRR
jgi:hypothetical protein